MAGEEELGFLSRWSRRKRGQEVAEPQPPAPAIAVEAAAPEVEPEAPAEPEFDPASLPDVETMDAGSDFTAFLKPGVPQALRNAALRKAWTADPLIRDFVNSLDYAWDFNTPGGLPNGFSDSLGATGEALRKLISQAIGAIEPEEEEPRPIALAEAAPPELEEQAPEALEAPAEPEDPVRLAEAPPPPAAVAAEDAAPPPRRRHGGALPA